MRWSGVILVAIGVGLVAMAVGPAGERTRWRRAEEGGLVWELVARLVLALAGMGLVWLVLLEGVE